MLWTSERRLSYRRVIGACLVAAFLLPGPSAHAIGAAEPSATASDDEALTGEPTQVRVDDERLRSLLLQGLQASATLRTLVRQLEQSDLIVYIRLDPELRGAINGRLQFVSKTSQNRFVQIRIAHLGSKFKQIALMGHELQHALEVAQTPAIVDQASFHREYDRIGYVTGAGGVRGAVTYETAEATAVTDRILRELLRSTE